MSNHVTRGYYVDPSGALKRDRRGTSERRSPVGAHSGEDRRNKMRRKTDRIDIEREHHDMIEDALKEFAEQHEH